MSAWEAAMRRGDFAAAHRIADGVLRSRDPAGRDDPNLPYHERFVWDGTPLDGRDVLVRCYHGLGDTIQFARFLTPARARAASVTLEVQPVLTGVLAHAADRVVPFDPAQPLAWNGCAVEIMELAHALRSTIPPPPSWPGLSPPSGLPSPLTAPARIGLCWQAGQWDPRRSVPEQALHDVCAGRQAYSLLPPAVPGAHALLATARLIAGLDLVITVDTMVAHLSGTLGRPTWLLLRHHADWRWMDGRDNSPWYPSMRLFRQRAPDDWSAPLARIRAELSRMAAD